MSHPPRMAAVPQQPPLPQPHPPPRQPPTSPQKISPPPTSPPRTLPVLPLSRTLQPPINRTACTTSLAADAFMLSPSHMLSTSAMPALNAIQRAN
eukprot:6134614-Pleurochrysis_carterae.AAC.1